MNIYKKINAITLLVIFIVSITCNLYAGRDGAIAAGTLGGFALGTIIGSSIASRNRYDADEDYIDALEQENADLRDELRARGRNDRKYYRTSR